MDFQEVSHTTVVIDPKSVVNSVEVIEAGQFDDQANFALAEVDSMDSLEAPAKADNEQGVVKRYECAICKKLFNKIEVLKRHSKIHSAEKEFKCSYCKKCFDRRDVLNDHVRNHTGEKPFQCTICFKKFTRGFVLLRHMRTHNTGMFKCDYCQKHFDRKDAFRDHVRNHTGEKPFECSFCGKAFTRSFVLTKHEKSHLIRDDVKVKKESAHHHHQQQQQTEVTLKLEEVEYDDEVGQIGQALMLDKDLNVNGEVIAETNVESEIIQTEEDFHIITPDDPGDENLSRSFFVCFFWTSFLYLKKYKGIKAFFGSGKH